MGVLLLGLYKWVLRCVKLFFIHPLVKLKTLSIFSALCLFRANYFIIIKIFKHKKPELSFVILIGIIGSFFIFKDNEIKNEKI
jgi:hypothetical protein